MSAERVRGVLVLQDGGSASNVMRLRTVPRPAYRSFGAGELAAATLEGPGLATVAPPSPA
jgi:hypothetical protein